MEGKKIELDPCEGVICIDNWKSYAIYNTKKQTIRIVFNQPCTEVYIRQVELRISKSMKKNPEFWKDYQLSLEVSPR